MDWKTLLFSLQGRTGRKGFWLGNLAAFLLGFAGGFVVAVIGRLSGAADTPLFGVFQVLVGLASGYTGLCLNVKRLHDLGRSGWLVLAPVAVLVGATLLLVLLGLGGVGRTDPIGVGATVAWWLLVGGGYLAFYLWLGFVPGDPAPNRFGSPEGRRVEEAFS